MALAFSRLGRWTAGFVAGHFLATAGRTEDPTAPGLVVMKQFVVEAMRIDRNPWLYVSMPEYEILSRCDKAQTTQEAQSVWDNLRLESRGIVWPAFLPALPVPMTLILFDREPPKSLSPLLPSPIKIGEQQPFFGPNHRPTTWTDGCVDVSDGDTQCVVQNRWEMENFYPGGLLGTGPVPAGVLFMLTQVAPAPPLWYQLGFAGSTRLNRIATNRGYSAPVVSSALWVTRAQTQAILTAAQNAHTLPELPPIGTLLNLKGSASQPISPDLRAEAALLVRWGLFGDEPKQPSHTKAFATFCQRARTEPSSEMLVQECFGFGYAALQSQLSNYLLTAAKSPLELSYDSMPSRTPRRPELKVRKATSDEIGRILGDWMRIQGNSLREIDPALSRLFFDSAGRLLARTYREDNGLPPDVDPNEAGDRTAAVHQHAELGPTVTLQPFVVSANRIHDPRLLAVYGLYEHDIGDDAKAREFLTAAVNAKVVRPAANLQLAQIDYAEAQLRPAGANGTLSGEQLIEILKPLLALSKSARIPAAGYRLIADAWANCAVKPTLSDLTAVDQGLSLYPFDSALHLSVAKAYVHWAYTAEAQAHVSRALNYVDDATAKQLTGMVPNAAQ